MDKGVTRNLKGRLRIAAVMTICLVALAVPAVAHAASFANGYPADASTVFAPVSAVGIDLFGVSAAVKSATITIGTNVRTAGVTATSVGGHWVVTSNVVVGPGGLYVINWQWVASGADVARKSLTVDASGLATGTYTAAATAVDVNGVSYTSGLWTFTIADAPAYPTPPAAATAYDNTICTGACHKVGGSAIGVFGGNYAKDYVTDIAMGPNCVACHQGNYEPVHTIPAAANVHENDAIQLETYIAASGQGKTCAACHGTSILPVGFVAGEHKGCSCHVYHEAEALKGCVDCHAGAYAPHGFASAPAHGTGYYVASGHNTSLYPGIGGKSDWSTSKIKDTVNATPTAQYPLAPNNTFKGGYDWTSTITCEDCHSALTALEIAGPHGSTDLSGSGMGIDPAYPGEFATATLWGGKYEVKATDMSTGVTLTIGPFATGIAQWAPLVGETEELIEYQVVQPDTSTVTSAKFALGTAAVSDGNVICVKCHDLYDASKSTGYKGWGNYAHEHHSADTGTFKMYFGKYELYGISEMGTDTAGSQVEYFVAETADAAYAERVLGNALRYQVFSADDGKTGLLGNWYYQGTDSKAALALATSTVPAYASAKSITAKPLIAAGLGREVAGQCRNCHIAIPHGWKRPRLIVYSNQGTDAAGLAFRASKGLPAAGDSAPYNIGPAVDEGEGISGTGIGSGQMNGLASESIMFKEAWHLLDGSTDATAGTPYDQLLIETEEFPYIATVQHSPTNTYVNWSAAQCNACGHHSSTSFTTHAAAGTLTYSTRELNWSSTGKSLGAWK